MNAKSFYKSKTFWFGALFIVNSIAQVFGFGAFVPSNQVSEMASLVIGILILILRYRTDKPISFK